MIIYPTLTYDENRISIGGRVCTFELEKNCSVITVSENCDDYFAEELNKQQLAKLISALTNLYEKMK